MLNRCEQICPASGGVRSSLKKSAAADDSRLASCELTGKKITRIGEGEKGKSHKNHTYPRYAKTREAAILLRVSRQDLKARSFCKHKGPPNAIFHFAAKSLFLIMN